MGNEYTKPRGNIRKSGLGLMDKAHDTVLADYGTSMASITHELDSYLVERKKLRKQFKRGEISADEATLLLQGFRDAYGTNGAEEIEGSSLGDDLETVLDKEGGSTSSGVVENASYVFDDGICERIAENIVDLTDYIEEETKV